MHPNMNVEPDTSGDGVGCGIDEPVAGNYFISTYPPFSAWTSKAVDAVTGVLDQPPSPSGAPLGLYVHIPFCVERCRYCYFLSHAGKSHRHMDEYADAVADEWRLYRDTPAMSGRDVSFVYFGGGTPSLLPGETLARLLERLQGIAPWTAAEEVCFECAPKTVTASKMKTLRDNGITRLSLGVQTFNDHVLQKNGRIHLAADVDRAHEAIRGAGFPVVNIDLIVGLPGETAESFLDGIDRVIAMAPESVTIYQLEIPLNTPLYHDVCAGPTDTALISWHEKRRRLGLAFARLEEAGYDVRSAYSAVRDAKKHVFIYQDRQYHGADLLGLGVASFSYLGGVHFQNVTSQTTYLDRVRSEDLPIGRAYSLNHDERLIREFILQLKLGRVDVDRLRDRFGVDPLDRFASPLDELRRNRWIQSDTNEVELSREGLLRVDRWLPMFYPPCHRGARYS